METPEGYGYVAHEVSPPSPGIYQVQMFAHFQLEGLQKQVNDWLKARDAWILRVLGVTHDKDGKFHYATVLYSEREE